MKFLCLLLLFGLPLNATLAQEAEPDAEPVATEETSATSQDPGTGDTAADDPGIDDTGTDDAAAESGDADALQQAKDSATGLVNDATERAGELAETLDQNQTVQDVSTGLLHPIYVAAEAIAFPAFHWIAFALMAAGVVSYAFQLVLGKLVVLTKGSINLREILSDTVGLLISAIGLVLTTQAATENSGFPGSPTAVLSSAAVGIVLGLILYRWNQAEEIDAAHGRRHRKD